MHSLILAPPTIAPCEIAKWLKGESSLWIHQEFPYLHKFNWQDGYAAFTVNKSAVTDVVRYIQNQLEHRQEEFSRRVFGVLES
ncbi:MAG: hypothetical protein C5B55_10425 [Blastocatellia bacterium]|nr:MAG: hypothetical protein C5B55_10425 [Blastocatellia bacterium]